MKRVLLLFLGVSTLVFTSCEKNELNITEEKHSNEKLTNKLNNYSIVTEEEYNSSSPEEKHIFDKINAAVVALDKLNDESYQATIFISKKGSVKKNLFSNSIIISKNNEEENHINISYRASGGKCSVCGVRSAYSCLKELQKIKEDEFDVHVKRKGKCVELTW